MKRALAAALFLIALSATPAHAFCYNPVKPGSPAFNRDIRRDPPSIIVRGVIGRRVPKDAHAAWSIFLHVDRYLVGHGPKKIEITSYSDGDLVLGSEKPGASKDASRKYLKRVAGQQALFFAGPERKRYDHGYATGSCLYNRVGHRDVVEMQGYVLRALAGDGVLVATGTSPIWAAVGLGLVLCGFLARRWGMGESRTRNESA